MGELVEIIIRVASVIVMSTVISIIIVFCAESFLRVDRDQKELKNWNKKQDM